MKLKRLAINRLPGISQPFEIEAAGAGFHVVFGPNGIGKSSICRAVEGLYWEDRGSSRPTSVTGEFELDGETWWGEREGARTRWQRGGENNVSPNLPPSHNSRCFFLNLRDLIDPSRDGTADIASEIRRQMSGGFDLDRIASDLFTGVTPQRSRRERNDFNKAAENVQEAVGTHADLQRRADQLEELKTELHDAETATHRLTLVERAIGLARRREELVGIVERIKALPGALANRQHDRARPLARLGQGLTITDDGREVRTLVFATGEHPAPSESNRCDASLLLGQGPERLCGLGYRAVARRVLRQIGREHDIAFLGKPGANRRRAGDHDKPGAGSSLGDVDPAID